MNKYDLDNLYRLYPNFDINFYKSYHKDLSNLSNNELIIHYHNHGKYENRICKELNIINLYSDFDINFYKSYYKDLSNLSDIELIYHYHNYGKKEGRICNKSSNESNNESSNESSNQLSNEMFYNLYPDFDINFYKSYYKDLSNLSDIELIYHYHNYGKKEGRICNKLSNEMFYNLYPDFDIEFYKIFYNYSLDINDNIIKEDYHLNKNKENYIINKKIFINTYLNFDIEYYKNFNIELINLSEYKLYSHYHSIGYVQNINYNNYDFIIDNYYTTPNNIELFKENIYEQKFFREIDNYFDLMTYNKKFEKKFYIYNKISFYFLYKDFDFEFYKNKYFKNSNLSEFDILLYYHTEGKYMKHIINNKYKIIIYTLPFNITCGGIVVMHYLAKIINDLNHPKYYSKLFMHNNLKYNNIFCNDFASIHEINDNTIVIYPEIVKKNPLNCKNIIRWILLDLGIEMPHDQYKYWNKTDLIYYWESLNNNHIYSKQLCFPWLNSLFVNKNLNRTKNCYITKKGYLIHKTIDFIHPENSVCIDNFNLKEKFEIFNESTYFYCYDPNTMYAIYATMCGCKTIIYPIENINKNDYIKSHIYNYNNKIYYKGIAYGNSISEITFANNTINEAPLEFTNLFNSYKKNIDIFINDLDLYFTEKKYIKNIDSSLDSTIIEENSENNIYLNNNINNIYYRK
jgi:hypothetical protein